jgi:hypothetical protein
MTEAIVQLFVSKVDCDVSYSNRELQKILSECYKEISCPKKDDDKPRKPRNKRERDDNGAIIKKRPPSAYNLFIKEQSAKIREAGTVTDSKQIFKLAIEEWKKTKGICADGNVQTVEQSVVNSDGESSSATETVITASVKPKKLGRKPKKVADEDSD